MSVADAIAALEYKVVQPVDSARGKQASPCIIDLGKDKRRFPRVPCEIDAALQYQDGLPAMRRPRDWQRIKVQNLSRCGMGFLHHEPLYPLEKALIVFPGGIQRLFQVRRCRRIGSQCFEIGGEFSQLLDTLSKEGLS